MMKKHLSGIKNLHSMDALMHGLILGLWYRAEEKLQSCDSMVGEKLFGDDNDYELKANSENVLGSMYRFGHGVEQK